ncbi:RNA-directed DNA polymerase [Tenacibaculum sp. ZS6-P6]|uniref:RNA-directed DNA polymerase n=1 Tax=Tenacibaculum sp. ZS6-P6 TaxID=3447503 RepID=UPI003F996CD5
MNNFELIRDLEYAYRKLKSYIYHENFSLDLRMKISEFERDRDVDEKFRLLAKKISNYINNKELCDLFSEITYSVFPKRIEKNTISENSSFYFSNSNIQDSYQVTKITPFINCPVEIHVISVLWIMKIGKNLDFHLSKNCYGNILQRDEEQVFDNNSIHLFEKYFNKYNEWRDNAIKKAKEIHNQKNDVAILNLDIKEYYNSVDLEKKEIIKYVPEDYKWLNDFLFEVHEEYRKIINKQGILNTSKNILPIGLLSSSILSNFYLIDLDKRIENNIKPEYYGRYVDDILLVISNPQISKDDKDPVSVFLDKYLINQDCWNENLRIVRNIDNQNDYNIEIKGNTLIFQDEKVKLYHLFEGESIEILNKFEKEIKKNSSEFRLQPEAKQIFETFNSESYELIYSDTVNKIRSIDGIKTNKLGASKHLRKLISATQYSKKLDKEELDNISSKILDYFSGVRSLELNLLWEKVITFFVINKAENHLIDFIKAQSLIISSIEISNSLSSEIENVKKSIIETLKNHLHYSISMSATLNRKFFKEKVIKQFLFSKTENDINKYLKKINNDAHSLIEANMFRQNYSFFPLLNYCKQSDDFSYTNQVVEKNTKFKIDPFKIKYSPRFIHYHEIVYFHYLKRWNFEKFDRAFNPEKKALEEYLKFNKLDENKGYGNVYPRNFKAVKSNLIKSVVISDKPKSDKLKIAIANIKVNSKNSISSMLGKPNLSFNRLNELNVILNQALKNKCELIIFPEICLPYQWVSILTNFSRLNSIGIIAGVEHFTKNNRVYNYILTTLPFKFKGYKNLYIDFRLKKDYSPDEVNQIIGRKDYSLPLKAEFSSDKLRLYLWKGLMFSSFNCFELCDIEKRSLFRGNVDFLVAIEHNRDLTYFSNIVESVSRDIHAYIIQVNTSQYGDSRINQPSKSYLRDIAKIKGGENVSILTAFIDIEKLRVFQSFNNILQEKNNHFKPTPPNYEMNKYRNKS